MQRPYKIAESVLVVIYTTGLDVLLIERAEPAGFWQSVTGSKDAWDEELEQTAVREVAEETGICVGPPDSGTPPAAGADPRRCVPQSMLRDWHLSNVYEIYPMWRHRYPPGTTRNTEHVFGLCVPRDIPVTLSPREHSAWLWLPWREAADKCFSPSNAEAILQLPRFIA